jgi:O-succinylbenzoate synthase
MAYLFEFKRYRLPLAATLRTAHGSWTEREGLIVRLESEAGRVGFGEIAPLPWFGTETHAEAEEICRKFGPKVTDGLLDGVPGRFGCVRFALAAARAGPAAGPGQSRLPVAALLPAGREALAVLPAKLAAGFLAFKWKVGVSAVEEELGLLDDLLAELPAYVKLRLDANGAWDRRQAAKWLARCAERPVEFVEQPVRPDDEATLLGLAADYPVTLALDESVTGLAAAQRWQGLGWRGVFVIKPALAGPLDELVAWSRRNEGGRGAFKRDRDGVGARGDPAGRPLTQPLTEPGARVWRGRDISATAAGTVRCSDRCWMAAG